MTPIGPVQRPETRIALFQRKEVRRIIHNNEWWFSVVDVVAVLTDSANPRDYWFKMKTREKDEVKIELSTVCRQLKTPQEGVNEGSGNN